jgi:thioredoxin-dependent peroxiredoxin
MPISANVPAPEFSLKDETGKVQRLADYRGKAVVLYFYPRDDTPGCTTEACGFRDSYADYTKAGVVILGVSADTPESHAKFKEKFHLPFSLLADEGHKICDQYGVWGPKTMAGRTYEGIHRTTFLIGPDGRIVKVFEGVRPDGHSQEVFSALKEIA